VDARPDPRFQDYFDALMSGNLARKRMTKFMPADFKLIETRQPPLGVRWLAGARGVSPVRAVREKGWE
jgi:hypothetical protein